MRKLKVFKPEKRFEGWFVCKEITAYYERCFDTKEEAQGYYKLCRNEYSGDGK